MKKACLYISHDQYLLENKIFENRKVLNNHESTAHFALLKKSFKDKGFDLSTQDINKPKDSEIIIYFSLPNKLPVKDHPKSYLIRSEPETVRPIEWDEENLAPFKKIFTWHDELVHRQPTKYTKFNIVQQIPKSIKIGLEHKRRFCTLIAGNKSSKHPLELYSKRIEAIEWFEKNHLEDFDLYGTGWNYGVQRDIPLILRPLRKIPALRKIFLRKPKSYLGIIKSKKEILEKYRFVICYENIQNVPGYITEKIFDCFFAGCIPVYWGANNVSEHIPRECFIDKRDFLDCQSLYQYLKLIKDTEYLKIQSNILKFIQGSRIKLFSGQHFANILTKEIFD